MVTTENLNLHRGAVLLAELKELVDSFPAEQRNEIVNLVKRVIRELGDHYCGSGNAAELNLRRTK